jgi:uncharacterized coiled-coil protein SlyX
MTDLEERVKELEDDCERRQEINIAAFNDTRNRFDKLEKLVNAYELIFQRDFKEISKVSYAIEKLEERVEELESQLTLTNQYIDIVHKQVNILADGLNGHKKEEPKPKHGLDVWKDYECFDDVIEEILYQFGEAVDRKDKKKFTPILEEAIEDYKKKVGYK